MAGRNEVATGVSLWKSIDLNFSPRRGRKKNQVILSPPAEANVMLICCPQAYACGYHLPSARGGLTRQRLHPSLKIFYLPCCTHNAKQIHCQRQDSESLKNAQLFFKQQLWIMFSQWIEVPKWSLKFWFKI